MNKILYKALLLGCFLSSVLVLAFGCNSSSYQQDASKLSNNRKKLRDNPKDYPLLERYADGQKVQEALNSWQYEKVLNFIKSNNIDVNTSVYVAGTLKPLILSINHTIDQKNGDALFDYIVSAENFEPNHTSEQGENGLFSPYLSSSQLKNLISRGANVNQVDEFGNTPLTQQKSLENIQTIIEHPSYTHNQRAINEILAFAESHEMARYLFSKGAKITFNQDNRSPLFNFYAQKNPLELFELSVEQAKKQGLSKTTLINAQTNIKSGLNPVFDGDTILHECIRGLASLVNKTQKDREIESLVNIFFPEPIQESREYKLRTLIRFLIEQGADITIKNKAGLSPADLAKNIGLSLEK